MQRGEDQVTGLGDGEGGLDGLQVPHLADEHDVRILPEHVAERLLEGGGVRPDLPLVDHAGLVRVEVLDRVLDGHDVLAGLGVDLVDHGGQRGGFPAAGGAGDQHEAAGLEGQLGGDRRQAQLLEGEDLEGDGAEGAGDGAALHVDVGPEPGEVLDAEGEVDGVVLLELDLLLLGEHRVAQGLGVHRRQGGELEGDDGPVDAQQGGGAGGDVHVTRPLLDHRLEELVEVDLEAAVVGLRHGGVRSLLVQSAMVTRITSSGVVTPARTLRFPAMRRVFIPLRMAASFSSAVLAPWRIISRRVSFIRSTS